MKNFWKFALTVALTVAIYVFCYWFAGWPEDFYKQNLLAFTAVFLVITTITDIFTLFSRLRGVAQGAMMMVEVIERHEGLLLNQQIRILNLEKKLADMRVYRDGQWI